MTLVNFTKKHRRRNGGIRLLGLIDQREVVSATYSELDKGFTELTLDEGASLSKFEFLEDGAEYRRNDRGKGRRSDRSARTDLHARAYGRRHGSRDRGDHRSIAQRPDRRRRHDQRRRLAARLLAGIRQGAPGCGSHRLRPPPAACCRKPRARRSRSRSEDVSKARPLLDDLNNLFSKI